MDSYISFQNITKRFGGTVALRDVSFSIKKGEVHCLCGENGAGKSTLINLCCGVFQPTEGKISVNETPVHIKDIKHSEQLGFRVVHQEVPLCLNMSIAHNLFLGSKQSVKGIFINEQYMQEETQKLLDQFELHLDPKQLLSTLSLAEQSFIQIAKAIYFKPEILILDEPTASLSNDQRAVMYRCVRELMKTQNTTVLYVSHRLEEVMELGDRVTILRDGQYIETKEIAEITMDDIIASMVGRNIDNEKKYHSYASDETLLEVKDLSRAGEFDQVSFSLKKGEILGIAGFVGAGRTELLNGIFGVTQPDSGQILIEGKPVTIKKPAHAINHGLALIPENRRDDALFPERTILDNSLVVILKKMLTRKFISKEKCKSFMENAVKRFHIKVNHPQNLILTLSGGNQQKVIIARWISNDPKILLCDEPTRGIDVGAKAEVYDIMREIAKNQVGIIMVSSELPELLTICDRILVLSEGRLTGQLTHQEATEEQIIKYASAYTRI